MRVERVVQRLTDGGLSLESLRRAGAALGHELHLRRRDVLRSFRAALDRVQPHDDTFAKGYLTALLDVTASYEEALAEQRASGEQMQRAVKKGWRDVLAALSESAKTPSELANELGKDPATVARLLRAMREEGLLENYAPATEADARTRPHRLTLRGQDILESLGESARSTAVPRSFKEGLELSLHLFRRVAAVGPVTHSQLSNWAEWIAPSTVVAGVAFKHWLRSADSAGLIVRGTREQDETVSLQVRREMELLFRWREALTPSAKASEVLASRLEQLIEGNGFVFLRTTSERNQLWSTFFLMKPAFRDRARTITDADVELRSKAATPPKREQFSLVYDDPFAITKDAENQTMNALWSAARQKVVIARGSSDSPPAGFYNMNIEDILHAGNGDRPAPAASVL